MMSNRIYYKNNINKAGGSCSSESVLISYLNPIIEKFNHRYNKSIGFYGQEIIEGENLKTAISILTIELTDLIDNYHTDADPNGFGRSALKVKILNKERILDHFSCKIDQIIYALNGFIEFLTETLNQDGKVEIYGLSDLDVLDCELIWKIKNVLKSNGVCIVDELKKSIRYLFHVDNIIEREPDVINKRLKRLVKRDYLEIQNQFITLTNKGNVVDVWTNFLVKTITIDKEKLKKNVC
ncbi:hypothetical protein [Hyunsoonleella pacifica]|uniref:Uncharacterized protein n=1 Tax=Hyunsoonleella pacifica TaxID=1080224 RepID=A0A4Q9FUW9_9FLAO|nr:hypothetical protein [Hyunsoonleella pacifica]TBN19039.1 hypothetical protein EYD46_02945 [Hyunsoonleella pacifica]GGD06850.1 hypothetical protein GCM10011368_05870 [Hyunsoonleella pacifica]